MSLITVRTTRYTSAMLRCRVLHSRVSKLLFALLFACAVGLPSLADATPSSPNTQPEIATPDDGGTPNTDSAQAILDGASPDQRKKLEGFLSKLDKIDRETEISAEDYNAAKERLKNITNSISRKTRDLEALNKAYNAQAKLLNERAVSLYRNGKYATLEILFSSVSFTDFISRLKFVSELSSRDGDLLKKIARERNQIQSAIVQLKKDKVEAESLEFELKARKIEVTQRNKDREENLRRQNPDLIALLEATQRAEAAQEEQVALNISTGSIKDVAIQPGSPSETALAYRGIKYVWGGASKSGFDCSGLVLYVFNQHGVSLPHYSGAQFLLGERVEGSLLPNDVVFFGSPIHHVGIYIGGGYYIHAPRTGDVVKISELAARSDLVGARRYDWKTRTKPIK